MLKPCANLEAYHHRDLDDAERADFETHLEGCASCQSGLTALRGMDQHLRAALSASWVDVGPKIRGRIAAGTSRTTRVAVSDRRPLLAGFAAAAGILIAAAYVLSVGRAPATAAPPPRIAPAPETAVVPPPAPPLVPPRVDAPRERPAEKAVAPTPAPSPAPAVVVTPPVPDRKPPVVEKPAAPTKTVVVRARVEKGRAYLSDDPKRAPIQVLLSDQEYVAESPVVLAQSDATRLEAATGARLSFPESKPGVHLAEGTLMVERFSGEEAACTTAQAEVRFQASRFSLSASPGSTRLLMQAGTAKFFSIPDGTTRQLRPGQLALAPAGGAVDPKRIDDAIKKGVEFLRGAESIPAGFDFGPKDSDELILLTLVHAGVPENDPKMQELLKKVMDAPLESVYEVSLLAMALEDLNRAKYQLRIWQCAQFLVDNQCKNGQWSYGKPTIAVLETPTGVPSDTATGAKSGPREFGSPDKKEKPKVLRKLPVRRSKDGIAAGDNSNSQYAALGLRACHDAGIIIPREVISQARAWWVESQIGAKDNAVSTGKLSGVPQGWCYRGYHHQLKYCKNPDTAYASMTAGAVGALAIHDTILGMDWKKDKTVLNGLAWLAANWSWSEVIGPSEIGGGKPKSWLLYYYYAIERTGMLLDTPKIGDNEWYPEGATLLLDGQKPNGSWSMSAEGKPLWDTCFAILFLKRATRPLDVASEDRKKPAQDPK